MGDVTLFVCGGGATSVMRDSRGIPDLPVVYLNTNDSSTIPMAPEGTPGSFGDECLASALAWDNEDEIRARMKGMRVVMVFAVLGGGTGTAMLFETARMARDEGCRVVSIVGLPMPVEHERRVRSMEALSRVGEASDRMFILDMGAMNRLDGDIKFLHVLRMVSHSISFAVGSLARMMEGPFFSTLSKKVYTFAYTNDLDPTKAVDRAMESTMFVTDPSYGKAVVLVSSGFGTSQIESIFYTVVSRTGIVPDIVKREDREDTKVLVFLPVQDFGS